MQKNLKITVYEINIGWLIDVNTTSTSTDGKDGIRYSVSVINQDGEGEIINLSNNINSWNNLDVTIWLNNIVLLPEYSDIFKNNDINGEMLLNLDRNELQNHLGIQSYGHIYKILKEIKRLKL